MPGDRTKGGYVGKTSVIAFKRRCPDSALLGLGGLVKQLGLWWYGLGKVCKCVSWCKGVGVRSVEM